MGNFRVWVSQTNVDSIDVVAESHTEAQEIVERQVNNSFGYRFGWQVDGSHKVDE